MEQIQPWYKQFWPWMLIALPLCSVVSSLTAAYIFTQNKVSLVAEDYYEEGKGINIEISQLRRAANLGLLASLQIHNTDGVLIFDKGALPHYPTLMMTLSHRTLAAEDVTLRLTSDAQGRYRFQLPKHLEGPWFIVITPFDNQWKLQDKVHFPTSSPAILMGYQS